MFLPLRGCSCLQISGTALTVFSDVTRCRYANSHRRFCATRHLRNVDNLTTSYICFAPLRNPKILSVSQSVCVRPSVCLCLSSRPWLEVRLQCLISSETSTCVMRSLNKHPRGALRAIRRKLIWCSHIDSYFYDWRENNTIL